MENILIDLRNLKNKHASVLKWSTRGDCKSPDFGLRKFESFPAHKQTNGFGHFFVRRSD